MPTILFLVPALAVSFNAPPGECPCQASGGLAFHHEREYPLNNGAFALVKADSVYRTDRCPLPTADVNGVYYPWYEPAGNVDITFHVKEFTTGQAGQDVGTLPSIGVVPPGTKKVIVKVRNATAGSSQVIALGFASTNLTTEPLQATLSEYKLRYTNDFLTGQFRSTITNIQGSNMYYQHRRSDGTWPNPLSFSGVASKVLNMYVDSLDPGNGSGPGGGIGGGIGSVTG